MVSSERPEPHTDPPATYFAPAKRATPHELADSVDRVVNSPIWRAALTTLGGWVAVLNENRQVLAVNDAMLSELGVTDPGAILGLRPGEMLHCAHARDHAGGCGTGRVCASCGAAIAIVAALDSDTPYQCKCAFSAGSGPTRSDRVFDVRCSRVSAERESFLLLCLRDISREERRLAFERAFLHDVATTLTALSGTSDLLTAERVADRPELLSMVREATDALVRDVKIQRLLCQGDVMALDVGVEEARPSDVLAHVEAILTGHPAAEGQTLVVEPPAIDRPFATDVGLLTRVLINMVVNGCEAGEAGDQVRVRCEAEDTRVTFAVWSSRPIPGHIAGRVFQRYFSTKSGEGRGTGTYAMKLLGESLLQGEVDFTTSPTEGTTFRISLPADAMTA